MSEVNELSDRIRGIASAWERIFEKANATPDSWKPHWPYGDLAVVDEMVKTLANMIARERAPTGFGPNFQLARVLANNATISLQTTVAQLTADQWNYLPTFVTQINALLSQIHSLIIFSERPSTDSGTAQMAAQLSEALALLDTAQAELAGKKQLLDATVASWQATRETAAAMAEESKSISAAKEAATVALGDIGTSKSGAADAATKATESKEKAAEILATAAGASAAVVTAREALEALMEDAKKQSKVIDSVLPKAASAGLADAFAGRGAKLEKVKWAWLAVFAASLIYLGVVSVFFTEKLPTGDALWTELLWRFARAAPVVWLAWVSIVQYGNIIRVQEDYAFKEATSKAFQGYRDHMEHMQKLEGASGSNALDLMAATTINILGREPLRIYGTSDREASPANSFLGRIFERFFPPRVE